MRDQGTRETGRFGWQHPLRKLRWLVSPDGNHRIEGTVSEQIEQAIAGIADQPEPESSSDLWGGPVRLAMWSTTNHDPGDEDRS